MNKIIIDSSVAIKWFVKEEGSDEARKILQDHLDEKIQIVAPDILVLEVLNALLFKAKFTDKDLLIVAAKLYEFEIEYFSINQLLAEKIIFVAKSKKITMYDGLFLALAMQNKAVLYTADKKHHKKECYARIRYI